MDDVEQEATDGFTRPRHDRHAGGVRPTPPAPGGSAERERLRTHIIEQCLPIAERIARRYDRRGETHDDLVQVARVGLMNAVNRFDPEAGTEFLSYAIPTMLGEVKRYFRDCSWSVNVPRRLKDLYPALGPLTAELTQRWGGPRPRANSPRRWAWTVTRSSKH